MIELKRHIEILLLDNDCVIIPGLGGFVAHYVEARYDERDNSYLPPLRTLGFNSKLDMNDSLLAQSYVEAYDISYPEAVAKIEAEVDDIKHVMEKDGYYDFSDLGTLMVNSTGNFEFAPCESGILTPDLYGLSSFEISRMVSEAGEKSDPEDAASVFSEKLKSSASENDGGEVKPNFPYGESKLAEELSADSGDGDRTISIKVSMLRNFFAAACAIVAFFLLATPINTETNNEIVSGFGSGLLYNLISDNTNVKSRPLVKTPSARTDVRPVRKAVAVNEQLEQKDTDRTGNAASGCYSIVLASRIAKSNAEAYVQQLHAEGYKQVRVLDRENEYLKVVYGSYEDENAALRDLRSLRDKPEFENAWIYKTNK